MRPSSTKSRPSSGSITLVRAASTSSTEGMTLESSPAPEVGSCAIVSYSEHPPVICCAGDEDRSTQSLRRPALSRALHAGETVLVDLHELVFADPSLMVDLAMVARRLRQAGGLLHIRGAQPQIVRLIEVVGLHRLPTVVLEPAPAPACPPAGAAHASVRLVRPSSPPRA